MFEQTSSNNTVTGFSIWYSLDWNALGLSDWSEEKARDAAREQIRKACDAFI